MTITVLGTPGPQGSKRFLGTRGGKGILVESSKAVKPWRAAVCLAAREAMQGTPAPALRGPVAVSMVFTLRKPASAPKRRTTHPDRKPDLSKLVRSTEDALTDAGVWEDDARVVSCLARKCYPGESLDVPGAVITIEGVNER